jgi:membrane protease YdiL (CAAX protease family)
MNLCSKSKSGKAVLTTWGLVALTVVWLAFAGVLHAHLPQNISWEFETLIDLTFGCGVGFVFCPTLIRQLEWKLELNSLVRPLAFGLLVQFMAISILRQSNHGRGIWVGLIVVVLAPIAEEILARGMYLRSLTESQPQDWIIWVLLVSSFMAVMHRWFWLSILQQGIISLAYLKPKPSLARALIIHVAINGLNFAALTL